MQLLRTPWSMVFIMYEDSTVAPSVAVLWGENNHSYIKRQARNGTCRRGSVNGQPSWICECPRCDLLRFSSHYLSRAARHISIRAGWPVTPPVTGPTGGLHEAYSNVALCVCSRISLPVWLSHTFKITHTWV